MLKIKSKALAPIVLVVIACLVWTGFQKRKLVRIKVNDRISAVIPSDWMPMDAMDFTQRYPSVRAPLAAYTDMERLVDFSVNVSATQWPDGNLEMSKRFFKASILNMFDRVEMIDEGYNEFGKEKLIFFEFESRVEGERGSESHRQPVLKYTYIQYWVRPDQTLVFTFNAPRRLKDDWQETAREIMTSLKLK
jgi:hypothetical protein